MPPFLLPRFAAILGCLAPLSFLAISNVCHADSPAIDHLQCEYLHDPLGLDVARPRLSWGLTSDQRGEVQAAYQVLVASSKELLDQGKGNLWDSGRLTSDQSQLIEYGGSPLTSREHVWWKVKIWDGSGAESSWSEPAQWEMGLLQANDWQAKWLDAPITAEPVAKHGTIAIQEATYVAPDGAGSKDVTPLVQKGIKDNEIEFKVSNGDLGGDPFPHHVKQLVVTYTIDAEKHQVTLAEGETLTIPEQHPSLNYLRKDFTLTKTVAKARLYATALGLYELHLNGNRVGDHLFAPDWTDYSKRSRYQVYDVTGMVHSGENTLAGFVGKGWYAGHIGNGGYQAWGKFPALFAQLEVTYQDGTVDRIVTDGSWKTHAGPILSSDLMLGENYNAEKEIAGWDQPDIDLTDWYPATEREEVPRELDAQVMQPVRQTGERHPKAMTEPKPGHWTYDLGQNMVGFVRIQVNATAGTVVTLHHAEMLQSDGTIYTTNLRGAPSIDTYICKGGGEEIWQPHFTFHGFRYVEITGLPQPPTTETVTGIVLGTDLPMDGKFICSDPQVNQLQSNIQWGMRGNYLSVPTDCPQRDERMGWMGDAEVFIRTAAYNGNIAPFFTKWLVDVDDTQWPSGAFNSVGPAPKSEKYGHEGVPGWADAGVICPWTIYLMYGDKRILEEHLPAMTRWIEWCRTNSTELIRNKARGHDYGDWLSQGESTSKELIGTAYFAYSTSLVAKAYRVTGDTANADKYDQLFEQIKAAFNQHYVEADGRMKDGTQTAYCMALRFNLLPDNLRAKAAEYFAANVEEHKDHLTTGFIGVSYLLPALTSEGQLDAAYRVFLQKTFPSWLFSVEQGATTIWERWDGWTPEKGFQNPGMNSFNHYSLGSCGEWMFDAVAGIGIDPENPGFKHIVIHPHPGGTLTSAEGSVASPYGKITTKWTLEQGKFSLNVTIPPNTTATVVLPTKTVSSIHEGGKTLSDLPAIKVTSGKDGEVRLNIGSGDYQFTCQVP